MAAEGCEVLPGLFGILVQVLLFLCCVGILVFKKYREKSRRTWYEFGLDSSKQLLGAGWIHIMNLLFAKQLEASLATGDQCDWYWVNIMVDTTLGVYVEYLLLSFITRFILKGEDYKTGAYQDEHGVVIPRKYFKQLAVWLFIVTGMKMSMLALMLIGAHFFEVVANFILTPVNTHSWLKLLVVMIATPVCMNSLQFWVVDNIIKKKGEEDEPERQPIRNIQTGKANVFEHHP